MAFPSPPPPGPDARQEPARAPRPAPTRTLRVWLLRHGAVAEPGVAYGDRDVALSPDGEAQTARAAERMADAAIDAVVSSPLARARRLGEAIARATGAPLSVDDALHEVHRGAWQDLPLDRYDARWRADADAYWKGPLTWNGHGGESEAELLERTWPRFLDAVARVPDGGTLVVTAHRQVIRALTAAALGIPVGQSFAMELGPTRGVELRADGSGEWLLARWNVEDLAGPQAADPPDGTPEDVVMSPLEAPGTEPPISR